MTVSARNKRVAWIVVVGLLLSSVLAGVVSFYASSQPDGLERVAEDKGFLGNAQDSATKDSPLADYGVKGVENERLSVGLAGLAGVGITLVAAFGLFYALGRKRPEDPDSVAASGDDVTATSNAAG